jgi:asparagine synthase (glutamine-hydrolysing)
MVENPQVRGASPAEITRALSTKASLSGLNGFAGQLPDGRLVRDALGREPLFVDEETWAFRARDLVDPTPFPPGAVGSPSEETTPVLRIPQSDPRAVTPALSTLQSALDAALETVPDGVPTAFSGGLDSAIVAAASSGPCYALGTEDAPDVEAARSAAQSMDRRLDVLDISLEWIERTVPSIAEIIGSTDPLDVSIALCLFRIAEEVAADGFDRLALGQGADELFGGYEKVAAPAGDDRVGAETVHGARDEMIETIPQQATRDVQVLRAAGVEPEFPFLTDVMVSAALELPPELIVHEGERKRGLRRVATDRLPEEIVDRDKQALQYGSRMARELDRLARQAGFKRRQEDHVGRYIRDRIQADRKS